MYEIFDHTADLGVRVSSASLEGLFADAGRGLFAVIAGDLTAIRPEEAIEISLQGHDPSWLLFDWLRELHAAFEPGRLLLASFDVTFAPDGLRAIARGERYDPSRHVLAHEVKAVTQHGFDLRRAPTGWEATFILDI
jgi:SHS2 domain-containing protein